MSALIEVPMFAMACIAIQDRMLAMFDADDIRKRLALYHSANHTRLSIGKAMHRCATTPDCAGGCVMTRSPAMGQLWRDGDGRWVRR